MFESTLRATRDKEDDAYDTDRALVAEQDFAMGRVLAPSRRSTRGLRKKVNVSARNRRAPAPEIRGRPSFGALETLASP